MSRDVRVGVRGLAVAERKDRTNRAGGSQTAEETRDLIVLRNLVRKRLTWTHLCTDWREEERGEDVE